MTNAVEDSARAAELESTRVIGRIIAVLAEIAQCEPSTLSADTQLFSELGIDSTGMLDLLMRLEDELHVEFDANDLELAHLQTPALLAEVITPLMAG